MINDEYFMNFALEEARKALDAGEFPVGCVIVQDGTVLASGNRTGTAAGTQLFSEVDHAEIRALKNLEQSTGNRRPPSAVLYSTMEPCLMCYAASILSGIKRIVYAYEDPMGGGTQVDLSQLPPLYKNCGIEIISGVLRQKSLDLFYDFFDKEENLYWKGSYLAAYTLAQGRESK